MGRGPITETQPDIWKLFGAGIYTNATPNVRKVLKMRNFLAGRVYHGVRKVKPNYPNCWVTELFPVLPLGLLPLVNLSSGT